MREKVSYQRSSSFHFSHPLTGCGKQFSCKRRDKPHAFASSKSLFFVRELVLVKFAVMICIYVDVLKLPFDRRRHSRRGGDSP